MAKTYDSFDKLWDDQGRNFNRFKNTVPLIVGKSAQRFFTASFNNQGFTDQSLSKWQEVQRRTPGTSAYRYPKRTASRRRSRAILVNTGKLRADVSRSLKSATFDLIRFEVESKYAAYHNEGTDRLPQRRFIGNSATLHKQTVDILVREFEKVFR